MRSISLLAVVCALVSANVRSQTTLTESEVTAGSVVRVAAFSRDSKTLVVGTMSGLKFWNMDRGGFTERDVSKFNGLDEIPTRYSVLLVEDVISEVLVEDSDGSILPPGQPGGNSGDGRVVAYGDMPSREMRVVDYESGQRLFTFPAGLGNITEVEFSPDNRLVAAAYQDTNIYVWDLVERRLVQVIDELPLLTYSMKFSADGSRLFTGGVDRKVRVWNTGSWQQIRQFETDHPEAISFVYLSADERYGLTSGVDTASVQNPAHVVLWDVESGMELARIRLESAPQSASLSPDGKNIAVVVEGEARIRLWAINDERRF